MGQAAKVTRPGAGLGAMPTGRVRTQLAKVVWNLCSWPSTEDVAVEPGDQPHRTAEGLCRCGGGREAPGVPTSQSPGTPRVLRDASRDLSSARVSSPHLVLQGPISRPWEAYETPKAVLRSSLFRRGERCSQIPEGTQKPRDQGHRAPANSLANRDPQRHRASDPSAPNELGKR